jgi:hypothetical protein
VDRRVKPARATLVAALACACTIGACAPVARDVPAAGAPARLAVVHGRTITSAELLPALIERAGADALAELVLHQQLQAELARAGLVIDEAAIGAERALLVEQLTLAADARGLSDEQAEALIDAHRRRLNLSASELREQLRTNASLRALASPGVVVNEAQVAQAHALRHGQAPLVRLLAVPGLARASQLREQLGGAGADAFAQAAMTESIDPSGRAGGLLGAVHEGDPGFALALRQALAGLAPGQVSGVFLLPGATPAYALARVEAVRQASATSLDEAAPALRRELTLRAQRQAMDELERRLVEQADVIVLDPALSRQWPPR